MRHFDRPFLLSLLARGSISKKGVEAPQKLKVEALSYFLSRHGVIYGIAFLIGIVNITGGRKPLEFYNPIVLGHDAAELLADEANLSVVTVPDGELRDRNNRLSYEGFLTATSSSGLADATGGPLVRGLATIEGNTLVAQSSPETITIPKPSETLTYYTVVEGDTVSEIALRYGLSPSTVLWSNSLTERSLLKPGQLIVILPTDGVLYKVQSGDTLASIARQYHIGVDTIQRYNRIAESDTLSISDLLLLPGATSPTPPPTRTRSRLASLGEETNGASFYSPNAPPSLGISSVRFIWPTVGRVSQPFRGSRHTGVDIANPSRPTVYASAGGVVAKIGWGGGYGYMVLVNHQDGTMSRYAHLSKIFVSAGQAVNQGDAIGKMGSSGRSTGSHLHFEIIEAGRYIDPLKLL